MGKLWLRAPQRVTGGDKGVDEKSQQNHFISLGSECPGLLTHAGGGPEVDGPKSLSVCHGAQDRMLSEARGAVVVCGVGHV